MLSMWLPGSLEMLPGRFFFFQRAEGQCFGYGFFGHGWSRILTGFFAEMRFQNVVFLWSGCGGMCGQCGYEMAVFSGVRRTPCFSDLFLTLLFELVKGVCADGRGGFFGNGFIHQYGRVHRKEI
jgi:hypothetical protein